MGYRSSVRIITTNEGWNKLKEFSKRYLQEKRGMDYTYLFDFDKGYLYLFEKTENNQIVYGGWNDVKWYESEDEYDDIDSIMKGLYYLEDLDIPYRYVRIGEDYGDYEERGHINRNIYLPYISLLWDFDDAYMLEEIKESDILEKESKK